MEHSIITDNSKNIILSGNISYVINKINNMEINFNNHIIELNNKIKIQKS